ncbi:MAG TPA: bifunctional DedA family/phosphatase PAP2 family protein [Acidimicrobiales bacterium]
MTEFFDALGRLAGPTAYLVVAVLAALEASAFVGLFVPGELAMLVGGYIAYEGRAELVPMMLAAVAGAVIGDSVGYEIGRYLGGSIRRSRLGQKVGEERWTRAENYLVLKGGRAVFLGRFIGVLRALVPALAGVSRMPYRRFLFWNFLGAAVWAPSVVGLGYIAGGSYRRVEHYAGQAGLVLLGLVVVIGGVAALGRWASHNPDRVRALMAGVIDRPVVIRVRQRYQTQLGFLVGRLRPGGALGLALTLQLMALGLTGWAFGAVMQDVVSGGGAVRVDGPITRALLDRQVQWLTDAMQVVTDLGGWLSLAVLVVVVGLVARRYTSSWTPLLVLSVALVGGIVLTDMVKSLVARPRPTLAAVVVRGEGFAFPSGHATYAIAVYGGLAYLAAGWFRPWAAKVAAWTIAIVVVLLVGFSRVYLGSHWATDVLGGYALGAVWLAAVLVSTSAIRGAWHRHRERRTADMAAAEAAADPTPASRP